MTEALNAFFADGASVASTLFGSRVDNRFKARSADTFLLSSFPSTSSILLFFLFISSDVYWQESGGRVLHYDGDPGDVQECRACDGSRGQRIWR